MSKIDLARETGKQVPTGGKYGKNTRENENPEQVGVLGNKGKEQERHYK
jgi:hypothetical protein